jgi:hypothetical protein
MSACVHLSSGAVAKFFIDTSSGQVATQRQLIEAGLAEGLEQYPPRPWLRVRGSDDATMMWFAVLRRQEKGIHIGTLVFRHSDTHSLLLERGWEDVPVAEIGAQLAAS